MDRIRQHRHQGNFYKNKNNRKIWIGKSLWKKSKMEIEEKLSDSHCICRLCGQDKEETSSILDHPIDKALSQNITFFLPIEVCKFLINN